MIKKLRRLHLLAQPRRRIVVDALVALFQDDIALARHDVVGEHQAAHAVGLEIHQGEQMLARGALEIAGVIRGREGILLAADGGKLLGEAAGRVLHRALEHQMLEEMRDPGFPIRLIGSADAVPQHVGDDRRAVVGNDHDRKTVVQGKLRDIGCRDGAGGRSEQNSAQAKGQGGANQGFRQGGTFDAGPSAGSPAVARHCERINLVQPDDRRW